MSDILCIYYSRTGTTKKVMREIAAELDAELVEITDGVSRGGLFGWLRCGRDAVSRTVKPIKSFQTQRMLRDYRLVVVGSPMWAGRCSSVVRSFLKEYGKDIRDAAFLITRGSEQRSEEVFEQMDLYTPCGHRAAGSLRLDSIGYDFWKEEFLRQVREFLG